jgi:hypothetical protein
MINDILRGGLWELGIEQGGPAPLRELFPAGTTAQQADMVVPIHLADDEVSGACPAKQLAFSIDTGESVQVRSLHEGLLQNSRLLSQGLHPTRHRLSTPLRSLAEFERSLIKERTIAKKSIYSNGLWHVHRGIYTA